MNDAAGRFAFSAMASSCEVRLAGGEPSAQEKAAQAAIDEVRRIERTYSRYRLDSIVSRINAAAGTGEPVAVDAETRALLGFADQLHQLSGGRFDITSGVLRHAWDFRAARLPDPAQLEACRARIGWSRVQLSDAHVSLTEPGMELDFGGFGKEYAADRAATILASLGCHHGYVNLGGDIRSLGPQPDGAPWRFGIQHPRRADATVASVELTGGALATSGDYERFFDLGGRRYCHILDPRTGWPVSHWQSVSVTAPACVAAGAMTTIALLLGAGGPDFLRTQGVAWLAVDAAGQAHHEGL